MKTVLISVDALRADHLGQYGYHRDTMPALDALADQGTTFERAFANGSYTATSVPSFLTSRIDGKEYIRNGKTVGSHLRKEGVRTAGFHSNTLLNSGYGELPGFDEFENFTASDEWENERTSVKQTYERIVTKAGQYLGNSNIVKGIHDTIVPNSLQHDPTPYVQADVVTRRALDWIGDHASDDFFVWIHYMETHRPYGYDLDDPEYTERNVSKSEISDLMRKAGLSPDEVSESDRELLINLYDSDIFDLSTTVESLFNGLKRMNVWDDSSVYFFADHGEEFGERGMYFHKNKPYPELLHVPLIVKHPRSQSERGVVRNQTQLVDVVLGRQQRVCETLLLALVGVRDGDTLELVAVVVDDDLLSVPDDDQQLVGAERRQFLETVRENWLARHLDHTLRFVLGQRPETGPFARGEHDSLHTACSTVENKRPWHTRRRPRPGSPVPGRPSHRNSPGPYGRS